MFLKNKHVLVTGGTGSLGKTVVRRMLEEGTPPKRITVLSRDEAKQHYMRLSFTNNEYVTDEIIYRSRQTLDFQIGDVRDYDTLARGIRNVDIVINAAALKQVPTCELYPMEAVRTNVNGAANLVRAIRESKHRVEQVVGISTDKACKPVNVMGMTKALMEKVFIEANLQAPDTQFNLVRYGNVIASRGSVVPLFREQIKLGGPVTITTPDMTRFLLSLDRAVDTVFAALKVGNPGETFVPRVDSAKITDLATAMIDGRDIPIINTGIRPGEKIHEIMVSEEERMRTTERNCDAHPYYVIQPMLEQLNPTVVEKPILKGEYSSEDTTLTIPDIQTLLEPILLQFEQTVTTA